jgi:hypothetical protein
VTSFTGRRSSSRSPCGRCDRRGTSRDRSHGPRRSPSTVVPVSVHSETPRSPATSRRDSTSGSGETAQTCAYLASPYKPAPPWIRPRGDSDAVLVEVGEDGVGSCALNPSNAAQTAIGLVTCQGLLPRCQRPASCHVADVHTTRA